jgi:diamine N-acetyltransferase
MAGVELRDIVSDADRAAVMTLERKPGQERYLGSMESHFEDAIEDAKANPRMWSVHDASTGELVGFTMISDDIPAETLEAEPDIVGPYFLWRLLIDARHQGRGYGRATIDAVAAYIRARPNGTVLLTSCAAGEGSPQPFYLHYGFEKTGTVMWEEDLLSLDLTRPPTPTEEA